MKSHLLVAGLTAALALSSVVMPSFDANAKSAAVTGLAATHSMRSEGGRLCFSDHYHYGSSAGHPSKKAAQADAVASWAGFTDFEYGGEWSRFGRAASKKFTCTQGSSGWGCDLEARPCR